MARVVLVLIGPDWVKELNRRAALPEVGFVRQEVSLALQRRAGADTSTEQPNLLGGANAPSVNVLEASVQSDMGAR
ncbi:hypothetical protein WKW80_05660 [Variovorax humicola]|uniref:Uncharacterized protein n=1 Tax=Variovorax humicola TaxID=1769758 RepID=A0ABU8VV02_9BURK